MTKCSKLLLASIVSLTWATTASAQLIVHGTGPAQSCYMSAKTGNPGKSAAIRECEFALEEAALTHKDRASTHVNLGILLMRKGKNTKAINHYKRAIDIKPELPEAYINYGASLVYKGEYEAAITAINKAINLGTDQMPEALYNRAIAYDRLQNYKGAYKDLKQALVLRPNWEPALKLLAGYQVTTRPKS